MILSKLKAYLFFQFILIALLSLYQLTWLASSKIKGNINQHEVVSYVTTGGKAIVYDVEYYVDDEMYFVRENIEPLTDEIRYNILFPSFAIINTFENLWIPVITIFSLFFIATSIIFLPTKNNQIIPNGSSIVLTKAKPFIKIIS